MSHLVLDADQSADCSQSEDSGVSPTVHPPCLVDMSEPFLEDQVSESKLGFICYTSSSRSNVHICGYLGMLF